MEVVFMLLAVISGICGVFALALAAAENQVRLLLVAVACGLLTWLFAWIVNEHF